MKSFGKTVGFIIIFGSSTLSALGGMISGTVKGPDGSAFKGAFVRARNLKSKITIIVLSNRQGEYRIQNVTPGTYQVSATAVGYKSDVHTDVKVDGMQAVSLDFGLQKGTVQWSDLSIHQGQILLPDDPGKTVLFTRCESCHGWSSKIASMRRDEDGWWEAVRLMQDPGRGVGDGRITEKLATELVPYLTREFGLNSELTPSPAMLPEYEKTTHGEFSDDAMKIIYVDYDLPGPNRFPWNANPDNRGNVWMPFGWTANRIAELNSKTGEVEEFNVPPATSPRTAVHVHSVLEAPDGKVWFVEDTQCRLSKFDPKAQKFTQYLPPSCKQSPDGEKPGGEGDAGDGGATSVRMDRFGNLWASGPTLWRFDPKTEKFMEFPEGGNAYGIELDKKEGNVWFTQLDEGKIGRADIRTLKITRWTPPATERLALINKDRPKEIGNTQTYPKSAGPRRITSDSNGIIWFGEWWAGNIGRFDPKTETFREFPLPGSDQTPYAVGVDRNNYVWYASYDNDILGCLDPDSGAVVEYPFPYRDNGLRELLPDSQGRMWFGAPSNNKVGYFIPPEKPVASAGVPDPQAGTWKLNLEKSKNSSLYPLPKSETLLIQEQEDGLKVVGDEVTAEGKTVHFEYSARYDGQDYPETGSPAVDTVAMRRINATTMESIDKKAGKVVMTIRRVISKDGRTRTTTAKDAKGEPMGWVAVFDRQ